MLVAEVMTTPATTIDASATLADVLAVMSRRGIRHLPVLDGERLVGMVSDRDLKRAVVSLTTAEGGESIHARLERVAVSTVMTTPVETIEATFPLDEAARRMRARRISALPVMDADRLVGIVTDTDVLELIVQATGGDEASRPGPIVLLVVDHRRSLPDLIAAIQGAGHDVSGVTALTTPGGLREVIVRVAAHSPGPAIQTLAAKGYVVRGSWRG